MEPSFVFHTCTETLLYTQMFENFHVARFFSVYHTFNIRTLHKGQHFARHTYAPSLKAPEGILSHSAAYKLEHQKCVLLSLRAYGF